MDTFGARLKSEREDRGLTIQAVAETLGVDHDRLLALERNDFEALPDEAVMAACLRAYAECLEVDAELMIEDYVQERERCLLRLAETVPDRSVHVPPSAVPSYGDRPRRSPRLAVVAAIAIVVVAGAWWMLSGDGSSSTVEQVTHAAPVATDAVDVRPQEPDAPAPAATWTHPQRPKTSSVPVAPTTLPRMSIEEYGVGTAVKKRRLVGENDHFAEGTQVWFWTRVEGGAAGDGIEHVWLEGGKEATRVSLKVGGSPWRTYSSKVLRAGSSGEWAVEARDSEGRVLARREFSCVP